MALYERDEYAEKHLAGPGRWFVAGWIIATVLGSLVGRTLADSLTQTTLDGVLGLSVELISVGFAIGLCVGVAQGSVLLRYLKFVGAIEWVGATIVGRIARVMAISLLSATLLNTLSVAASEYYLFVLYFSVMGVVGAGAGAVQGYMQCFVLERRVAHAHRWIWVNIGTSVLSFIALASINFGSVSEVLFIIDCNSCRGPIYTYQTVSVGPGFDILLDIIFGAITGYVLLDMLRHPTSRAEWIVRLKEEKERLIKRDGDTQPSPEALLEQRRGE